MRADLSLLIAARASRALRAALATLTCWPSSNPSSVWPGPISSGPRAAAAPPTLSEARAEVITPETVTPGTEE
jgi:hypothetical protein